MARIYTTVAGAALQSLPIKKERQATTTKSCSFLLSLFINTIGTENISAPSGKS
jgi:hypothetical protein